MLFETYQKKIVTNLLVLLLEDEKINLSSQEV